MKTYSMTKILFLAKGNLYQGDRKKTYRKCSEWIFEYCVKQMVINESRSHCQYNDFYDCFILYC